MDYLEFLTLGDNGIGDMVGAGAQAVDIGPGGMSASDFYAGLLGSGDDIFSTMGSGFFGADQDSINDLMSIDTDVGIEALQNAAADGSGVTGIKAIDKILSNIGQQWEKDPLAVIGMGIGILGKIDAIKRAREAAKGNFQGVGGVNPYKMPTRADEPFRQALTEAELQPTRGAAPVSGGMPSPGAPGALSRVAPTQIPILKG